MMIDNLHDNLKTRACFILISANFSNVEILYVYNRLSYNAVSYALYEST